MNDLERQLLECMLQIVVRFPDGIDRIEAAIETCMQLGPEISRESSEKVVDTKHHIGYYH